MFFGAGSRVQGPGSRFQGLEFRVQGVGFKVQGASLYHPFIYDPPEAFRCVRAAYDDAAFSETRWCSGWRSSTRQPIYHILYVK